MSVPLGRWRSRTPVRRGSVDAPTWGRSIIDTGSTVQRRHELADFERQQRENNPQLAPGMLVIHERAACRIVEIREYPTDLWPQQYQDRWGQQFQWWLNDPRDRPQPEKATWQDRPVVIVLEPDGGGEARHRLFRASRDWDVLPEHYAVCRSCGELPPCRDELMDEAVDRQMVKSELLMSIPAGNCMGCGEAISARQKTVDFPGPNLWRPDLPAGTARFHARGECSHWVDRYRAQWQAPGTPASEEQPALFGEEGA
jgi:hypothetical protein